jgi:hypothetical protein
MQRHPRIPTYRLHKPTGQAVVTINGKDFYLGKHDSPKSHAAYKRLVAERLANHQIEIGPVRISTPFPFACNAGTRSLLATPHQANVPHVRPQHGASLSDQV